MRKTTLAYAFVLAIFGVGAIVEAQGKPATVPVGPPATPVVAPAAPPENPPSDLMTFVCSILPVPYLCD